ncbi:hypothetical protein C8D79_0487 [Bacteriovorax stolpii]|nr:hypothetical protein [Bacteriovorax stolpii]TDP55437.1 hypothetical protein C8D79_0487 [Bacteriovorax stolpii]BDT29199.1 hypothetical protein BHI3_26650 [Bacteriovorax sp. HI3]
MSKKSVRKANKGLTQDEKELGKNRIYIILGMIVVGLAIAIYRINQ